MNRTNKPRTQIRVLVTSLALIATVAPIASLAQLNRSVVEEARQKFEEQNYEEAADRYRQYLKDEAKDGNAWYMLGVTMLRLEEDEASIQYFRNAIKNETAILNSQYNIACAYAKIGENDRALKELETAVDYGFNNTGLISRDNDLRSIRGTEGFKQLLARTQNPVEHYSMGRTLTNLFGVWTVSDEGGTVGSATTNIMTKGYTQQFSLDLNAKGYLYLSLYFSTSDNSWYVSGADMEDTAYTGFAEVSKNRIRIEGARKDAEPSRLSIIWSDEEHADLRIEDRIDGTWQTRKSLQLTETVDLDPVANGGR